MQHTVPEIYSFRYAIFNFRNVKFLSNVDQNHFNVYSIQISSAYSKALLKLNREYDILSSKMTCMDFRNGIYITVFQNKVHCDACILRNQRKCVCRCVQSVDPISISQKYVKINVSLMMSYPKSSCLAKNYFSSGGPRSGLFIVHPHVRGHFKHSMDHVQFLFSE